MPYEEPKSESEEIAAEMAVAMEAIVGNIEPMVTGMLEAVCAVQENDRLTSRLADGQARQMRKQIDALMDEGFTRGEAVTIACAQGNALAAAMQGVAKS